MVELRAMASLTEYRRRRPKLSQPTSQGSPVGYARALFGGTLANPAALVVLVLDTDRPGELPLTPLPLVVVAPPMEPAARQAVEATLPGAEWWSAPEFEPESMRVRRQLLLPVDDNYSCRSEPG
jgi:hypothetical protein